MKIKFSRGKPETIVKRVKTEIKNKELSNLVEVSRKQKRLYLTFTKLGTTTLTFKEEPSPQGVLWALEKEKIAFSHKVFKETMTHKIHGIIEKMGGELIS